ncbi:hypothetical protein D3C81_1356280 [compost metagenome]
MEYGSIFHFHQVPTSFVRPTPYAADMALSIMPSTPRARDSLRMAASASQLAAAMRGDKRSAGEATPATTVSSSARRSIWGSCRTSTPSSSSTS